MLAIFRALRLVLPLLLLSACHPLACFFPPALPHTPEARPSSVEWPKKKVEIRVDPIGVPHIFGKSDADLAYGLGVMHGRDRAFQILVYLRASTGTLTELFGEEYLEADRQQRLLTYRLDEQLAALSDQDRTMLEAYVAGVNEGAAWAGQSAEMFFLGVRLPKLEVKDALAIARLQQWGQAVGFDEEMARYRMVKALGSDDPRARELLADADAMGVPIVTPEEHDGDAMVPTLAPQQSQARTMPLPSSSDVKSRAVSDWQRGIVDAVLHPFVKEKGASNEWALHKDKTKAGVAVMANDPHLSHSGPGIFYMAHMQSDDVTVAGGTFPGIPAVLIGHGNDIAWGVTNAYADTMDVVVLDEAIADHYRLDGQNMPFGRKLECFKLGKANDAKTVCEDYLTTVFGPVLPKGYGSYGGTRPIVDDKERLVLMWTAYNFPEDNGRLVTAFWRLARAKNPAEATDALQDFSSPSMAVVSAYTNGDIAFRLTGIVPVRGDDQRVDFPRKGVTRAAGWVGRLLAGQKPQATNPDKGYLVAANQRVVDNDILSQRSVGFEEAKPFRAVRINDRLKKLMDGGKKPSTDDILAIQQDTLSLEAKALAPVFAAHCPKTVAGFSDQDVKNFCDAIGDFDGDYTIDSVALPYARTAREFALAVFGAHVDEELAVELAATTSTAMALHRLTLQEHEGQGNAAIFDDKRRDGREGLTGFVHAAVARALPLVNQDAGLSPDNWKWGKNHQMSVRGTLQKAPVVGFLFDTWSHDESGSSTAPRAEGPDFSDKMRVRHGAGLRLIAEMRKKPVVKMVNDSGNSGHYGHKHLDDQNPLWSRGEPFVLAVDKADLKDDALEGGVDLMPAE